MGIWGAIHKENIPLVKEPAATNGNMFEHWPQTMGKEHPKAKETF